MASAGKRSRSVERAFAILCVLAERSDPMGVSEIARRTGLPKSTVHLGLQTMRTLGFVEQEPDGDRYGLGLQAAQLGVQALDHSRLVRYLRPRMEQLAHESGEAVSLGIRQNRSVVFIERYETLHVLSTSIRVGLPMPLHALATGKVLLAALTDDEVREIYPDEELPEQSEKTIRTLTALFEELAQVRERGYAHNHDELYDGVSAAAVPVRLGNHVVAALSIAGPTSRFRAGDWITQLLEYARPEGPRVPVPLGRDGDGRGDSIVEMM
jgi:DNA-binding IclR family transcriptional regulator